MTQRLLILGGTTEARALAQAVADAGLDGIFSIAGRVERPLRQPLPQRVGGFGGVDGLISYLRAERITHLIDATHPFAAQMSRNAVAACAASGLPYVALTRAPWVAKAGDHWQNVPDVAGAVAALNGSPKRVMLAIGRQNLPAFFPLPQHFYLLRLVDPPDAPLPFPQMHVITDRGPFTQAGDEALMRAHGIELIVSKNSGGTGAYAKLAAARALGLPVVMIDRPALPQRAELHDVTRVMDWLGHSPAQRGV